LLRFSKDEQKKDTLLMSSFEFRRGTSHSGLERHEGGQMMT